MLFFFSYTLVEYESKHTMPKLLTKTVHEQKIKKIFNMVRQLIWSFHLRNIPTLNNSLIKRNNNTRKKEYNGETL